MAKTIDEQTKFIELRAKGHSFDLIVGELLCILLIFVIFGCKDNYERASEECITLARYYINAVEGEEDARREEYLNHREQLIETFHNDALNKKEVLYFVDQYQVKWLKKKALDHEISILMHEHLDLINERRK